MNRKHVRRAVCVLELSWSCSQQLQGGGSAAGLVITLQHANDAYSVPHGNMLAASLRAGFRSSIHGKSHALTSWSEKDLLCTALSYAWPRRAWPRPSITGAKHLFRKTTRPASLCSVPVGRAGAGLLQHHPWPARPYWQQAQGQGVSRPLRHPGGAQPQHRLH